MISLLQNTSRMMFSKRDASYKKILLSAYVVRFALSGGCNPWRTYDHRQIGASRVRLEGAAGLFLCICVFSFRFPPFYRNATRSTGRRKTLGKLYSKASRRPLPSLSTGTKRSSAWPSGLVKRMRALSPWRPATRGVHPACARVNHTQLL